MKKNKLNLGKLHLNKMTIGALQSLKGGRINMVDASGDNCDSKNGYCNSNADNCIYASTRPTI